MCYLICLVLRHLYTRICPASENWAFFFFFSLHLHLCLAVIVYTKLGNVTDYQVFCYKPKGAPDERQGSSESLNFILYRPNVWLMNFTVLCHWNESILVVMSWLVLKLSKMATYYKNENMFQSTTNCFQLVLVKTVDAVVACGAKVTIPPCPLMVTCSERQSLYWNSLLIVTWKLLDS